MRHSYRKNSLNHTLGHKKSFFSISYFEKCFYIQSLPTANFSLVWPNFCTPYSIVLICKIYSKYHWINFPDKLSSLLCCIHSSSVRRPMTYIQKTKPGSGYIQTRSGLFFLIWGIERTSDFVYPLQRIVHEFCKTIHSRFGWVSGYLMYRSHVKWPQY